MTPRTCKQLGGGLAVLLAAVGLIAPARATEPDFGPAREILLRGLTNRAYPGGTVMVGTSQRTLWVEAFGSFDYANNTSVSRTTIYDLASLTKVAGTTAVFMRLVALGKVSVNERVGHHLPEFMDAATSPEEKSWRQKITIEHLLTHTAGFASWKPLYKSVNTYPDLLRAIYATPLESEPGKQVRYSDLGMILAGELAARAGGKPLPDLERELVFIPLGMSATLRSPAETLLARIPPTERWPDSDGFVRGVVHDENARAGQGITGHAGLFSTAEDLGKLATEWLRALEGHSQLFPRAVVESFFRERNLPANSHRTLGWGLRRNEDGSFGPMLAHTGFTGTAIWIDPAKKFHVVLLTNRVHPTRDNNRINQVRRDFIETVAAAMAETSASKPE